MSNSIVQADTFYHIKNDTYDDYIDYLNQYN